MSRLQTLQGIPVENCCSKPKSSKCCCLCVWNWIISAVLFCICGLVSGVSQELSKTRATNLSPRTLITSGLLIAPKMWLGKAGHSIASPWKALQPLASTICAPFPALPYPSGVGVIRTLHRLTRRHHNVGCSTFSLFPNNPLRYLSQFWFHWFLQGSGRCRLDVCLVAKAQSWCHFRTFITTQTIWWKGTRRCGDKALLG